MLFRSYDLAKEEQVEMPITNAIYSALYQGVSVREAVEGLMLREGKQEAISQD